MKSKLIFFYLFVIIFCYTTLNVSALEVVDRIVAIVNNEIVTLFELNQFIKPYTSRIKTLGYSQEKQKQLLYKVREDMLNELINQKLSDQEARRLKIHISETEIDQSIERFKAENFLTEEDLRAGLNKENITLNEYRKRIKSQILRGRLVNLEVKSKIVLTDEDVKNYFDENKDAYKSVVSYHLRNILLKTTNDYMSEADDKRARQKADFVWTRLRAGDSFVEMAKKYSDSSLAKDGGDLGTFTLDQLSSVIRDEIKTLKPKEFTRVIPTDQGYQIFYAEEIIQSPPKKLEEVRNEIENKLFDKIVNDRYKKWLEKLRSHAHIKIIR